jgi:hypothetical protein
MLLALVSALGFLRYFFAIATLGSYRLKCLACLDRIETILDCPIGLRYRCSVVFGFPLFVHARPAPRIVFSRAALRFFQLSKFPLALLNCIQRLGAEGFVGMDSYRGGNCGVLRCQVPEKSLDLRARFFFFQSLDCGGGFWITAKLLGSGFCDCGDFQPGQPRDALDESRERMQVIIITLLLRCLFLGRDHCSVLLDAPFAAPFPFLLFRGRLEAVRALDLTF